MDTDLGRCRDLEKRLSHVGIPWQRMVKTNLATLLTSVSIFHRCLRPSRYSMAARSRAVITPSLSCALAFHIRTFPSSEPVITNLASAEKMEEDTLQKKNPSERVCVRAHVRRSRPLHPFRVINLGGVTLTFFPYSYSSIPPATNEFKTCGAPVTTHDSSDMCFVNVAGCCEVSDIERIEIMIF